MKEVVLRGPSSPAAAPTGAGVEGERDRPLALVRVVGELPPAPSESAPEPIGAAEGELGPQPGLERHAAPLIEPVGNDPRLGAEERDTVLYIGQLKPRADLRLVVPQRPPRLRLEVDTTTHKPAAVHSPTRHRTAG